MKNLISDLIKFQSQVPTIPKNSFNPHFKSYFADLATVVDICKPVLNKNKLCVIQRLATLNDRNALITALYHESGEFIDAIIFLPDIADPQKLTAAITYLRRTSYLSILGLVADDETDGNDLPNTQSQKQFTPNYNQDAVAAASAKQKELVKKLYPDMDITLLTRNQASDLIQKYNKGK